MVARSATTFVTPSNGLASKLNYINNARTQVELDSNYLEQDKVSFTRENIFNFFMVYKLDVWSRD